MRAWWSQLLVPKNDTNLRIRYACSLLCFELPTQNTASGPDSFLMREDLVADLVDRLVPARSSATCR